jgi:hypothetical protein
MVNTLVMMLICLAGWAQLFPVDARSIIHGLKHQLWITMLKRYTLHEAKQLELSLHDYAAHEGIEARRVDQFLAERRYFILDSLEKIHTDRIGNPDDPVGWE